jgi:signal transduction histidine kinase
LTPFLALLHHQKTWRGTVMGLAVVHGIFESSGGKIIVKSTIGKGTVFKVYLPIISSCRKMA